MRKKVKVGILCVGETFYSDSTTYVKQAIYNTVCYENHHIKDASFGLGVKGSNKNCIIVLSDADYVEIDVSDLTFADINIGEEFRINVYTDTVYTKIRSYSGKCFALEKNIHMCFDMGETTVVERVK